MLHICRYYKDVRNRVYHAILLCAAIFGIHSETLWILWICYVIFGLQFAWLIAKRDRLAIAPLMIFYYILASEIERMCLVFLVIFTFETLASIAVAEPESAEIKEKHSLQSIACLSTVIASYIILGIFSSFICGGTLEIMNVRVAAAELAGTV